MKRFIIFLTILLASQIVVSESDDKKLKHLIHVTYIGSRYPRYLNDTSKWEFNPMELTQVGMRQLYLLGRQIRQKYFNKLPEMLYNPLKVEFRSIYSDEPTITRSAYALAAGLYHGAGFNLNDAQVERAVPPIDPSKYVNYKKDLGNEALPHYYGVLPVMTLTEEPDYKFRTLHLCSAVNKTVKDELKVNETLKSYIEGKERNFSKGLYPKLKAIFGKDVNDMTEASDYTDYIIAAKYFSKELNITGDEYKLINELHYTIKFEKLFANENVTKLIAHGFLDELEKILVGIDEGKNPKYIFTSYTLDEVHILALLKLLGFEYQGDKKPEIMPFSSSLIIEVNEDKTIKILFNNDTIKLKDKDPTVKGLIEWTKGNIVVNFTDRCHAEKAEMPEEWFMYTFIGAGVLLLILAATWTFIIKCRRTDEEPSPGDSTIE